MMPVANQLLLFDRAVGNAVERLVRSHHGRRLRRIGWGRALDPPDDCPWAMNDPSPRPGNDVEVLVDGAEALPRMAAELRRARSHVHVAGWHLSPYFRLEDGGRRTPLRPLLAELAERVDVRVLLWAGSPLPFFRPDRTDVEGVRHGLTFGTRIRVATDAKERPMHCHHEKVVVIDDRVAFVGGIDLTTLEGDRFDMPGHPARGRLGWHDAAVVLRGPIVEDVAEHFRLRWQEIAGETLPPSRRPRRAGATEAQFVRTVPENVYDAIPTGDFGSWSRTRARCARLSGSSTSRTSSSGRARSRRSCSGSWRGRRPTASVSCSSSRAIPTTAATTRAASWRTCSSATAAPAACWHARCRRSGRKGRIPSTCTRRSGSSTTAGSPSVRRT
jgi:phosphatidylserine/phosphatidylglycerophosphate/cardiolipin synthase-like enzyme